MIKKLIISSLFVAGVMANANANMATHNSEEVLKKALSMSSDEDILRPLTPTYVKGAVVTSWLDNWFINVAGGASAFIGSPIGCEDLFGRIEPTLQVHLGKWYTPAIGTRLSYQGFQWKSGELTKQKYNHYHADFLWNIMPTISSGDGNCRWDIIPLFGVGLIDNRTADRRPFAINYGVQGRFRLADAVHITAEISNATTFKDSDGYGSARQFGDNLLSVSAGISWTFGRNVGWKKVVDAEPYIRQNENLAAYVWALKDENNKLSRDNSNNARVIAELRKILDIEGLLNKYLHCFDDASNGNSGYPVNDYSGLNSLRKRLRDAEKSAGNVSNKDKPKRNNKDKQSTPASQGGKDYLAQIATEGDCLGAPIFFFFELGTTNLVDNSQTVNLNEIARVANKYGLKIEVVGAADSATGTETINDNLGTARASFITEYLVANGITPSNISSYSEGGIDTYTPINANRNAAVRLFLP